MPSTPYNRAGPGQPIVPPSYQTPATYDEWGTPYDADGNSLAKPNSLGVNALTAITAPARLAVGIVGALSPYSFDEGWRVPPAIQEPIDAGKRFFSPGGGFENNPTPDSERDALTLLMSMYGGNALKTAAAFPKASHAALARGAETAAKHEFNFSPTDFAERAYNNGTVLRYGLKPDGSAVYISKLETPTAEAGRGQARSLMEAITKQADQQGMPLELDAQRWGEQTDVSKLRDFYRSLGFDDYSRAGTDLSHPGYMRREPQQLFSDNRPSLLSSSLAAEQGYSRGYFAGAPRYSGIDINALLSDAKPSIMGSALASQADNAGEGIIAYHGSPHSFDKFDMSKIGTGEGAQAYGHGLYFAENEGVARSYRDNVSRMQDHYSDVALRQTNGDVTKALEYARSMAETETNALKKARWEATIQNLQAGSSPGHMYQVRINANPNDFLDWDKPLSQQSEAIRNALAPLQREHERPYVGSMTGQDAYRGVQAGARQGEFLDQNSITPLLQEAGIPGIRYLDQISRDAGNGSSNYVVFDDSLIDILKKYGLAGLGMYGIGQNNSGDN